MLFMLFTLLLLFMSVYFVAAAVYDVVYAVYFAAAAYDADAAAVYDAAAYDAVAAVYAAATVYDAVYGVYFAGICIYVNCCRLFLNELPISSKMSIYFRFG
jgi:hypothetical protein